MSPGAGASTAKGVVVSGGGMGVSEGASRTFLTDAELCDPNLAYPRLPNPHHRTNPRGICLLINQRDFDMAKTGQEKRDGTDVDADTIERTFIRLGYAVKRAINLTLRKMECLLEDGMLLFIISTDY